MNININKINFLTALLISILLITLDNLSLAEKPFFLGTSVSKELIKSLDISIHNSGKGLPEGSGNARLGLSIFQEKCSKCHSLEYKDQSNLNTDKTLLISKNNIIQSIKQKWNFSPNLFDYIRKTMPYNQPQSLTNNEVYSVTAYLLYKMQKFELNSELNKFSLSKIHFIENKAAKNKSSLDHESSSDKNIMKNLLNFIKNIKYKDVDNTPYIAFHLGAKTNNSAIKNMDLSIDNLGKMLPQGEGNAITGEELYRTKCIGCHGSEGDSETVKSSDTNSWSSDRLQLLYPSLSGGIGTLSSQMPVKTVGSYWPFATTLFDYIRRAMPPNEPQSLTDSEVYSLTAYILFTNNIVRKNQNLSEQNLAKIRMPNQGGFINSWGPDWWREWLKNKYNIFITSIFLGTVLLTIIFSNFLVKKRALFYSIRILVLMFSLIWLGWANSTQPGIKNTFSKLKDISESHWDWSLALFEPLLILVFLYTIFTTFLFGRGLFCGWICPFGALQELIFAFAKLIKLKSIQVAKGFDYKAKYIKYLVFFCLLLIFIRFPQYSFLNNIEPFDSLIELKVDKTSIYILWLLIIVFSALLIQRPFCRYLCPFGAFLAILGKFQVLDWIKRRNACGISCNSCQPICPTSAINDKGNIVKSECISCLACQEMYYNKNECIAFKTHTVRTQFKKNTI